ncbi:kinase-like protein [Hesseltinella vesiculosa]|uniref:Kinase-like protein n=1 Tax=Hesseltinella vesiculosa TaxID=101127 RepID=A0A1X2GMN6_9FUNG|nr:kinase-like protein [Hesseltinella vesiculosa]
MSQHLQTGDEQLHPLSRRPSVTKSILTNKTDKMTTSEGHPLTPVPSQISPQDLPVFNNIDDFELQQPIGYGSSAVVYSALYKPTNKRVAVKMIDLDMFERNQIDELRRETALMALSKHPNVLRVYGSFVHGSKLFIVTPYSAGGSCLDIMKTAFSHGLEEVSIATILKQALEGLVYFHKNGHIHRDVKAGNLLMDEDGTVLLADFGVSSSLMETGDRGKRKTFVGTPCWMAPEVMEQAGYDYKADIWSFGITAIELATGHAPFAKLPPLKVLMMTLSSDPPTLDRDATEHKYSKIFKDMIDTCLVKDPEKRKAEAQAREPTAEKLLQHQFFRQAKKKDYLVKMILNELPPLEQRPRKKITQRQQITITKTTEEWDFDHDDPIPPKRQISFGDVVVKNPPAPTSVIDSSVKKSRFVIDADTIPGRFSDAGEVKDEPLQESGEIKVGRFQINQGRTLSSSDTSSSIADLLNETHQDNDRKSRFEVSHSPPSSSFIGVPLSRENSHHGSLGPVTTRTRSPLMEKEDSQSTGEFRKIGRFELSTASDHAKLEDSLSSSTTSPSTSLLRGQGLKDQASLMHQVEELIRYNDSQRQVLMELYSHVKPIKRAEDISMAYLEQQIQQANKENALLKKENDALRRELEQLRM